MEALSVLADTGSTGEQREAVYALLEERVVRADAGGEETITLAKEATKVLIVSVLCAQSTRIAVEEWQRAALLLAEMVRQHPYAVGSEMFRLNSDGMILMFTTWHTPGSHMALMIAKSEFTREDAILEAANQSGWAACQAAGMGQVWKTTGMTDLDMLGSHQTPQIFTPPNPQPSSRYVPLALQLLDLVRAPGDEPEALLVGAWHALGWMSVVCPDVGIPLLEAGIVELGMAKLEP